MKSPYSLMSSRVTPQNEAILGESQIANNAGGYVYALDDWKAFERFLILGSEGGTFYVGERKLTRENAERTLKCIHEDPVKAINLIVDISTNGRAPKNDPAIFALALAASSAHLETRALALDALPKVCRIPTHLFHFLEYVKGHRGWGRGLKRAVGEWYNSKEVGSLAYQVVKYQQRDGWSNRDALRKSHPKTKDEARNALYKWVVDGWNTELLPAGIPHIVTGFEVAKVHTNYTDKNDLEGLVANIKAYGLSREMLPTEALTKPEVWDALLTNMLPEAMIRNLGNMSKVGLLTPMSEASKLVVAKLADQHALIKARIHPIAVLLALKTYASGHGFKGSGTWTPVPAVVDALDDAFYLCFKNIVPTGKRLLFGVDVSGSMSYSSIPNTNLTAAEGAAAMAMACARTEKNYYIMGFSNTFKDLGITANTRLDEACKRVQDRNFGSTDCAVPLTWALQNKVGVDGFITITDNETWAGYTHPSQALRKYREATGIPAKFVAIGMTATNMTIADPNDAGSLDVAGFDASVPSVIQEFLK